MQGMESFNVVSSALESSTVLSPERSAFFHHKAQRPLLVVERVNAADVVNDIIQQVGLSNQGARGLVLDVGEVHMEVVVARLVVDIHTELVLIHTI